MRSEDWISGCKDGLVGNGGERKDGRDAQVVRGGPYSASRRSLSRFAMLFGAKERKKEERT